MFDHLLGRRPFGQHQIKRKNLEEATNVPFSRGVGNVFMFLLSFNYRACAWQQERPEVFFCSWKYSFITSLGIYSLVICSVFSIPAFCNGFVQPCSLAAESSVFHDFFFFWHERVTVHISCVIPSDLAGL